MSSLIKSIVNLPLKTHLFIGFLVRLVLIFYADFHDEFFEVSYTDVDYKVFTDAARYVVGGQSPYKRHTYRYSPLVAFFLTPNITIHKNFGRLLFTIFDILVAYSLDKLVRKNVENINKNIKNTSVESIAKYSALFWLYNPLSVVISTRGNADSIQCFFIIISLLFLETNILNNYLDYVLSGFFLGIAIHLRLYPLAYSLPMYLSLSKKQITRNTKLIDCFKWFIPNLQQISLAFSCIFTLLMLTYCMYFIYGYEFLFETYIYHLFRKDTKHNFSILFYYLYLNQDNTPYLKYLTQFLQAAVLFIISLTFGTNEKTLNFALFAQSVVMVAYNSVITSQYFIWFLALLPLIVQDIKITAKYAFFLVCLWFLGQGGWLYYAYLLEFKGVNTFFEISVMSYIFFLINIYILSTLIRCYKPGHGFGIVKYKTN